MKWYSVKKYIPVVGHVLVHIVRKKDNDSVICNARYHSNEEDGCKFEPTCYIDEIALGESEITHFCMPDPVEIEDENKGWQDDARRKKDKTKAKG
jgi:hypothetical protein